MDRLFIKMRIKFVLNLSEMHNDNLSQETDYYFKS